MDTELEHSEVVICESCGASNAKDAPACAICGAPLPAQPVVVGEVIPPGPAAGQVERGGCLSVLLGLSIVGGLLAIPLTICSLFTLQLNIGTLFDNAISVLYAVAAIALWKWKKWGLYLYVVVAVVGLASIVLSGLLGALELSSVLIIVLIWFVAMGIFYALVKPVLPYLQ